MVSGYTLETFTVTERVELPQSLTPTGTIVHYDTGYVTPGAVAVAPFFTFERTKGTAEDELEGAMNRCALNGAWCVRSLQLMYNKAYQGFMIPQLPTAFSCVIDNTLAIINYHWIDHGEEYYMANLRRFDFNEEGACSRFQAFVQAIERWALDKQLPRVKAGVEKLSFQLNTPPMTPDNSQAEPTIHYDRTGSESIFKALKTTFSNVPWRMEEDDRTPMPPSAMRSPLDTRTRTSIFDFSYDDVSQRASVAHYSSPRGHRRTESNLSDGSTVTSPLSPASFKRPHLGHSSRPSVPVIRLPASPKDRQTSPSSPAPPQWQQQLMSLSQEVQSLRKELQELKMSYPASPGVVSSAVGEHNHGEVGLAPIPEEIPSPANDMVVTVSTLPVSPSKRELTLTVTEISAETPSEDNFKHGSKHSRSSSSTVTPNTPVVEHDRGVLDNFIQRVRTKLSELSFWQIATSVYLTVLLGKLLVSAQHRDAVGCLVVP
ncbi:hypothetical protein UCRPC4_g00809 [Phaeomoniella chlamydospora]|uniref:DUF7924 domain-containing protein n=1 Tax=Phaeomoniella chlamydospora TaxID=158046 RepID=A0A0G2F0U0_PHACM|nr:hypothetical protein UCRPC4_g00809 [Phaeomoniella chlamydospora]